MSHVGLKLTTLTPFNYGHLLVSGGVATIPDVINDRAVVFALCAALGKMSRSLVLPEKDVLGHMREIPWRTSLFTTDVPRLLRPIARRSDLGIEGGYQDQVQRASSSGNFKEYFTIQEVPAYQEFYGILDGEVDPFEIAEADEFCIRVGSNRTGMVRVEKANVSKVRLNVATAKLFGRDLHCDRFVLDQIGMSKPMDVADAVSEMRQWH